MRHPPFPMPADIIVGESLLDYDKRKAVVYADELEAVLMEIVNGKRKADKIPMEPMVRLIAFARTGSVRNASIGPKGNDD
jgi:hypothetical protein